MWGKQADVGSYKQSKSRFIQQGFLASDEESPLALHSLDAVLSETGYKLSQHRDSVMHRDNACNI